MAADPRALYVYEARSPFPNAHQIKVLGCYSHGDCSHLFVHDSKLYRVSTNDKAVLEVAALGEQIRPLPTGDDSIPPHYFAGKKAVFF